MNRFERRLEKDLEAIARGEDLERQRRRQPAVVVSKDELRQQADAAMKAFTGKITTAPADPIRSPTFKKKPWNPFK